MLAVLRCCATSSIIQQHTRLAQLRNLRMQRGVGGGRRPTLEHRVLQRNAIW